MEFSVLFIYAALLLVPVFYFLRFRAKRVRMINLVDRIPGPRAFPLIGTVLDILFIPRNGLFKKFDERTHEFWPIFRTWGGIFPEVHLSLPQHVEVVLSNTTHIDKSVFYNFLQPWLGQGLLTSTGRKWHSHRKLITPTFHFKILENFMEVFVEKSEILVKKLEKEANGNGFDIYPYVTRCALDIICETAMGTTVNAQEQSGSEYVSAVYEISELTLKRLLRPWLYPNFVFRMSKMGKRYARDLKILHGFTTNVINERKSSLEEISANEMCSKQEDDTFLGKKKRKAFLDLLLETTDESGNKLSDQELREEVDTFMFEGHDTTTAGISWALFLLGTHTDIQEKVFKELDQIFQGSDRPATMRDLQEMKYLERVIKESLRLYPSVPFIGRCAKEDIKVGEYIIPSGSMISVHIYHVHRNPDYFPNPEEFNPDNFLPERVQGRHPYAYIPFSAGPRNCIGQKFAMLEEKTVLSYILRHYKVKALEPRRNLVLMGELILRPENGIKVIINSRHPTK